MWLLRLSCLFCKLLDYSNYLIYWKFEKYPLLSDSPTDNLKLRDASASKKYQRFLLLHSPKVLLSTKVEGRCRGKNNRTPNARTSHSYFLLWVHSVRECISGPMLNVIFVALHIIGHKRIAQFFQQSTFTWNDAFRPISSTSNPNSQHYTQNHCHHQSLPGRKELPSILINCTPPPPEAPIPERITLQYPTDNPPELQRGEQRKAG